MLCICISTLTKKKLSCFSKTLYTTIDDLLRPSPTREKVSIIYQTLCRSLAHPSIYSFIHVIDDKNRSRREPKHTNLLNYDKTT